MARSLKQVLLGNPLHAREAEGQRLSNPVALAIFSSDALSSVAYATEEILLMLAIAGTAALGVALPIAIAISVLILIVVVSYRQTIKAYPAGGGAYVVAKENLGTIPGLVAGGSLLVDYVLTVAVSVSAGTAAITSALPALGPYRVFIALALVVVLAIANLRGMRESGSLFAGPTYAFVGLLGVLIVVGLARWASGVSIAVAQVAPHPAQSGLTPFVVMMAFAAGCTAMTGIEAMANGVQVFREPAASNARKTLTWMAGILLLLFLGVTVLARVSGAAPIEGGETVLSQIARGVFGGGPLYYVIQAATAIILILAANTSYAGFPLLGSFISADKFLPNLLQERGQRLVHSNGILLLSGVSAVLIVVFNGSTARLIPLYAVGVFTSFTLSQAGMVVHWWRARGPRWRWSIAVNGIGALTTGAVTLIVAVAEFALGAWIVLVLVPGLVAYFFWVRRQYDLVADQLKMPIEGLDRTALRDAAAQRNTVVLLVSSVDRRILPSLRYARSVNAQEVQAVFIDSSGAKGESMRSEWDELGIDIPLVVIESPYREIIEPIRQYLYDIPRYSEDDVITVLMPQFVPEDWSEYGGVYVYRAGLRFWIKRALLSVPGVVAVDVPYHLRPSGGVSETPNPQDD